MVASFAPLGVATDVFVRFAELVSLTENKLLKSGNNKRKDDGINLVLCSSIVATQIRSIKSSEKINRAESIFEIY